MLGKDRSGLGKDRPGSGRDGLGVEFLSSRRLLLKLVSSIIPPKDVEDIVQEAYVKACEVKDPGAIRRPRSFLVKTAKNLALNYLKRAEYRRASSVDNEQLAALLDHSDDSDETYHRVAAQEEFAQFCDAVRTLPVQCRRAVILKKVYGFSLKEIAITMDISQSTVEKHIIMGIKKCTRYMQAQSGAATEADARPDRRPAGGVVNE